MKIDRRLVRQIILEQGKRSDLQRGYQPKMIYGCFLSRVREDTEFCERCRRYNYCKSYLKAVELREVLFRR